MGASAVGKHWWRRAIYVQVPGPSANRPARPRIRWLLLIGAGYLLFCHGCHGDEDNELFARWAVAARFQRAGDVRHVENAPPRFIKASVPR
jgi:hypothetical protein